MFRTGRSPLFQQLRNTFQSARLENHGIVKPPSPRQGISRRRFLASAAAAGLLAAYGQIAQARRNGPRIVVVGAGIAGLNATYLLAQAGLDVTLYEGSNHIGGRIQTKVGGVAKDVYTELGGEFIDTSHEDMLALAQRFDLDLIDTQAHSETNLQVAYYAEGKLRSEAEVIKAFKPVAAIVDRDYAKTSDEITYDGHSSFDKKLDRTDLRTYFRNNIKEEWLYEILEAAYVNEFGLNLEEQSSINFVWTIGTDTSDGFKVYGESDQRYKIKGGNHQIVASLAKAVADRTELGHTLKSLELRPSGEYHLIFDRDRGKDRLVEADIVVMCIPFSILRDLDLRLPLPQIKTKAIQELGYGTNAKLILGFEERFWREEGFGGDSYVDLPYQSGWDASRKQPGKLGAYTIFPGGRKAADLKSGSADDQARRLLPGLDTIFPGAKKKWLGTSLRAYWPSNPFVKGSYASYKTGQWTGIRGAEGETVGNLYFAGEHTSLDWQGYMNGGAESGRLAAEAIIG